MKRTQLYLDEDMWSTLRVRSQESGTTISELVRQAVRDKYLNSPENRRRAMEGWVGVWKDRTDLPDSESYLRSLRKGERLRRMKS